MPHRQPTSRYGIAELFGYQIDRIPREERNQFLQHSLSQSITNYPDCPFRLPDRLGGRKCTKKGGVCSIRRYYNRDGLAERIAEAEGALTITCPYRFHENREVFRWVGEQVMGIQDSPDLMLAKEVYFLETVNQNNITHLVISNEESEESNENVGRIDLILVDRRSLASECLKWCAIEIQAVYFSGKGMRSEFISILNHDNETLPFPNATRRPDYRSSAPKRLMPQLQIKIPSLRRWGKKMAVIVDTHFYNWIGSLEEVRDISNSDVVWFVVGFEEQGEIARLKRDKKICTTLERAIDGLTGGVPVALQTFEERIKNNILRGET